VIDRRLAINDRGGSSSGPSLLHAIRELRRNATTSRSICKD
jgi:hypothetical protein